MIRQGVAIWHDAIYLPQEVKLNWAYTLHAGYYTKDGESKAGAFYNPSRYGESGMIVKAALADDFQAVHVPANENRICVITVFDLKSCSSATFEYREQQSLSNRNFQQHLIYGGGYGNKINVTYREISSGYARPAFNHNVEYDLTESKTIGYKGARIRVIETTNEWIEYVVDSYFD